MTRIGNLLEGSIKTSVNYVIKPGSFTEAGTQKVEYSKFSKELDIFKKYTTKELYGSDKDDSLFGEFKIKVKDQYFIVVSPKFGEFLVNTEGYDYARYAVKLKT